MGNYAVSGRTASGARRGRSVARTPVSAVLLALAPPTEGSIHVRTAAGTTFATAEAVALPISRTRPLQYPLQFLRLLRPGQGLIERRPHKHQIPPLRIYSVRFAGPEVILSSPPRSRRHPVPPLAPEGPSPPWSHSNQSRQSPPRPPLPPIAVASLTGSALLALAVAPPASPPGWPGSSGLTPSAPSTPAAALNGHILRMNSGGAGRHKGQGKPGGLQQPHQE